MPVIASGQGLTYLDITTGGALQDISAGVESFSVNYTPTNGQWFTLANQWQNTMQGGKSWSVDLTIIFEDTNATSAYSIISQWAFSTNTASRTWRSDQPTSTTGSVRYEGETILGDVGNLQNGVGGSGDPPKTTVRLMGTGPLVRSIVV